MKSSKHKDYLYFFIDTYNSRTIFKDDQKITNIILKNLSKYLNRKFSTRLISNFEVREGDGILGGTEDLSLIVAIYEACLEFKYTKEFKDIDLKDIDVKAVRFYFGAGIGNITTGQETFNSVHNINGTAVSNAKQASDIAKNIIVYNTTKKRSIPQHIYDIISARGDYYYRWQDSQFYVVTDDSLDKLLNPTFYLAYEKYISSEKQNALFQMKKRYPELDLYLIGEKLGYELKSDKESRQKLSTQISNLLNKSNFTSHQNLLRDIEIYLKNKVLSMEGLE